ncbi:MAG: YraN family protein [Paludibacteraceae bacterium]|nr:YraN family protein [Paludibacteraceae bacterium]
MAEHNELGRKGELIAKDYLEDKGYFIRDCNWKSGHYELDIVAEHQNTLVIVEVKTRSNDIFASPFDAINDRKIRRIVMAASSYVFQHCLDMDVRFDVISVIPEGLSYKIEHIEDAFWPPMN